MTIDILPSRVGILCALSIGMSVVSISRVVLTKSQTLR